MYIMDFRNNSNICVGTKPCEDSNMFQCQDGTCLSKGKVCDGILDCEKGEDELQCENKESASNQKSPNF